MCAPELAAVAVCTSAAHALVCESTVYLGYKQRAYCSCMDAQGLPGEVLERVLAHVPFNERCGECWTYVSLILAVCYAHTS